MKMSHKHQTCILPFELYSWKLLIYSCFVCLRATPSIVQGLLWTLHSRITPRKLRKTYGLLEIELMPVICKAGPKSMYLMRIKQNMLFYFIKLCIETNPYFFSARHLYRKVKFSIDKLKLQSTLLLFLSSF